MLPAPSERLVRERPGGFTLIETLIAAALLSIVIAGIYLLYTTMQSTMNRGELKSDLQQNARVALDLMVREIRMAGFDPSGAIPAVAVQPKAAVRAATPSCFSFISDPLGSGVSKQITYDLNGTTLRRRADNWDGTNAFGLAGGAQPQAETVSLLVFTYYDAYDQLLTPASWTSTQRCPPTGGASSQANVQLDYWQMRQVRRVAVLIQTQNARPGIPSEFYTLASDVRLRNR